MLTKKQKWSKKGKAGILSMLLGTLGAKLLGNLLTGKGIKAKTQKYYQSKPNFNGAYSRKIIYLK